MNKGIRFLKILAVVVIGLLLLGLIVMSLWNWLIPTLFSGPRISFWQALGLFLLAKILFGGWRAGGRCRQGNPLKHKLASMTPEERERFKAKIKEKWCGVPERDHKSGASNV